MSLGDPLLQNLVPMSEWGGRWALWQASQSLRVQQTNNRARGFNERTQQLYISRWQAFCEHLLTQGIKPEQITQEHLEDFANSRNVHAANRPAQVSPATRARYINGIVQILCHAQRLQWLESDCTWRVLPERPHHKDSLVITPALLAKVRQCIEAAPKTYLACRDSLVLHLICCEALSLQELTTLRWDQISEDGAGWTTHLQMQGKRRAQERLITLQPSATALLASWREYIKDLPPGPLVLRAKPNTPSMTPVTVYHICAKAMAHALGNASRQGWPLHVGPNTLRNACLVLWLAQGVDRQEVARRAGLQRSQLLERLDHLFEKQSPLAL